MKKSNLNKNPNMNRQEKQTKKLAGGIREQERRQEHKPNRQMGLKMENETHTQPCWCGSTINFVSNPNHNSCRFMPNLNLISIRTYVLTPTRTQK